jgi:lysophospholipase L1-like esterase
MVATNSFWVLYSVLAYKSASLIYKVKENEHLPLSVLSATMFITALLLSLLVRAPNAQSTNATIRYMPFGDSITEIICWRAKLWERLQSTEYATVNFVGSGKTENNCKDTKYDRDNEGHSGFLAIDIANKGQLDGWLKANPADVVSMHLGTNDIVQQNKATEDILAAFTKLISTMRTSNPKTKIIVSEVRSGTLLVSCLPTRA